MSPRYALFFACYSESVYKHTTHNGHKELSSRPLDEYNLSALKTPIPECLRLCCLDPKTCLSNWKVCWILGTSLVLNNMTLSADDSGLRPSRMTAFRYSEVADAEEEE